MRRSNSFLIHALIGLIVGCSSGPKNTDGSSADFQDVEKEVVEKLEIPPFEIINATDLKVDFLLQADGEEFYSPQGRFHYFIGNYPIVLVEGKDTYFRLQKWNLILEGDTIRFDKRSANVEELEINPVASLNYQYKKYDVGQVYGAKLGKVHLTKNGLSCDDSYSGQVNLIRNNRELTIKGLANIDLFENSNGTELFVLSYHNCLVPDLRIYRIRE
ncbi:MAG TPA: hypothetical protein DIW47_09830 [Bacteroidetes bacterium]|nr:hypothetical protein [Bacteroidota bacterium]